MDVEFEDCVSELVAADAESVADSSDIKDTKQPSEEVERVLVGDTLLCKNKNYTEGGRSDSVLRGFQGKVRIEGRLIQCPTLITSMGSHELYAPPYFHQFLFFKGHMSPQSNSGR